MSAVVMVIHNDDGTSTVTTRSCMVCQKQGELTVKTAELEAWGDGTGPFIQDAMPSLSAGERELLMTGTHDACWDEMFADEEDEPEDDRAGTEFGEKLDERPSDEDVEYYAKKDQERFEESESGYGPGEAYQGMVDELDYPWNQEEEK